MRNSNFYVTLGPLQTENIRLSYDKELAILFFHGKLPNNEERVAVDNWIKIYSMVPKKSKKMVIGFYLNENENLSTEILELLGPLIELESKVIWLYEEDKQSPQDITNRQLLKTELIKGGISVSCEGLNVIRKVEPITMEKLSKLS
jgi:hypothetical protein